MVEFDVVLFRPSSRLIFLACRSCIIERQGVYLAIRDGRFQKFPRAAIESMRAELLLQARRKTIRCIAL